MKYSVTTSSPADLTSPCVATTLAGARKLAREIGARDAFACATEDFEDKPGNVLAVQIPAGAKIRRLLVLGGADTELTADNYQKLVSTAAMALVDLPVKAAHWALLGVAVKDHDSAWKARAATQAIALAAYRFDAHKSTKPKRPALATLRICTDGRAKASVARAVREGSALAAGLDLTRDLGNQPPNVCNPDYLLKEARKFARDKNVTVTSLDERKMRDMGMGAFISVTQGSNTPGRMIIIQYRGGRKNDAPIALVGKGITFDTGGISLKPPPAMDEMKFDMCGAAAVLGATKAVIDAQLKINLVTIVAAAENMPSGSATRPGDIVTSLSGKTIEILNTDAEGRLVLCDALTHAQKFKPSTIIDVATLTGAVIVALGSHASGVYANEQALADGLLEAGTYTGDKAWQMPLWDEYQSSLNSNFADVANVGGREAGSVTAACFLKRFIDDGCAWAHMDVAGSAFHSGARKGASGRPVPLLFQYLLNQAG